MAYRRLPQTDLHAGIYVHDITGVLIVPHPACTCTWLLDSARHRRGGKWRCPPVCLPAQDRKVVIVANLKPRNMRGVKSNGMVRAALCMRSRGSGMPWMHWRNYNN